MSESSILAGDRWTLRPGRARDVPAMHALDLLCFEESFRFDLRSMRKFALKVGAIVVVAEAAGELVGFVIVHLERRRLAYVVTLDVAPAFRRMGLAKALMIEVERQSSKAGADRLRLHVSVQNSAAINFYERLRFHRESLEGGFYGDGLDAWIYWKVVEEPGH